MRVHGRVIAHAGVVHVVADGAQGPHIERPRAVDALGLRGVRRLQRPFRIGGPLLRGRQDGLLGGRACVSLQIARRRLAKVVDGPVLRRNLLDRGHGPELGTGVGPAPFEQEGGAAHLAGREDNRRKSRRHRAESRACGRVEQATRTAPRVNVPSALAYSTIFSGDTFRGKRAESRARPGSPESRTQSRRPFREPGAPHTRGVHDENEKKFPQTYLCGQAGL